MQLAVKHALIAFLTVRVLASALAVVGAASIPSLPTVSAGGYSKPGYSRFLELTAGVWEKSDALWYLHIARDGYEPTTADAAFMPLYPVAIRTVELVTGLPWIVCALLVSNLAFLAALIFLFRLVETDFGPDVARRGMWYQALFPGALFCLAPYTESLFLLLAIAALFYARAGKWWHAGVCGMLLALTRNLGVLVVVPLLFEVFRQKKGLVRVFLVPLGFLGLMFFWYLKSGDAFAFVRSQAQWEREAAFPWSAAWGGIEQAWQFAATYPGGVYLMEAGALLLALATGVLALMKLPASYAAFLWVNLLPPLFAPYPGRMLMSFVRFSAVLFPIFVVLGRGAKTEPADQAIRLGFAVFYGLSVALFVANQHFF